MPKMPKFLQLTAICPNTNNAYYYFSLNIEDITDIYPYALNEHIWQTQYVQPPQQPWQYRPTFYIQYPNENYKTQITLRNGQRHCCLETIEQIRTQAESWNIAI
ncbi:TPA: hypothetical protein QB621_002199 [Pasteurella multocida]|nr:hypothetical protein [Pasteurella multocida]HDR1241606.1 hypothetical protein [Pasteurella multocida]HDR1817504.1 hypothetical protein [Pasteurella multocida]